MTPRILTVGHSTHPIDEFLHLLHGAGVTGLVDVRKLPGSRRNPQFNEENLASSLEEAGIPYLGEKRLGGLRTATHTVAPEVNGFWNNDSFHRYADYALSSDFAEGLDALIELAAPTQLPVIMCSEAVWWRCHRRIIADHLIARDIPVAHLMPDGRLTPATLTAGARIEAGRTITYPPSQEQDDQKLR
ncbi:DUF488 domain-containing protein [Microbacterium sp. Sa4CUA7]|uniref:DUF488 domain-containing protein n=1 Tax=Microbacterium pullorum TaxID=2762236 RepID=A0ABR8S0J1_9MICO|nr:DUF488 domain-containing protein [Microbacterium pullorum]MBD7956997.1 DUF488 domain-containing protein [Microbacterium pullorum]